MGPPTMTSRANVATLPLTRSFAALFDWKSASRDGPSSHSLKISRAAPAHSLPVSASQRGLLLPSMPVQES